MHDKDLQVYDLSSKGSKKTFFLNLLYNIKQKNVLIILTKNKKMKNVSPKKSTNEYIFQKKVSFNIIV